MATAYRPNTQKGLDWVTLVLYISLVLIGWLMIYTVGHDPDKSFQALSLKEEVGRHSLWLGISLVVLIMSLFVDWKLWDTFSYLIFGVAIVLLMLVLIVGVDIKGARSWFSFGGISFQPGEFAKFATSLAVASYLSNYKTDLGKYPYPLVAFGLIAIPALLILLQPDAGSALVFISFFIVFFREGLNPMYYLVGTGLILLFILSITFSPYISSVLLLLLGVFLYCFSFKQNRYWILGAFVLAIGLYFLFDFGYGLIALAVAAVAFIVLAGINFIQRSTELGPLLTVFMVAGSLYSFAVNWGINNLLKPHQQDRINVWLRPSECDPQGSLYNIIQSKMAIGSGGLQGKGFLQGNMTKLNYVPEQSSDFVFSIIGEEQGFIGTFSVIALFLLFMYRIVLIAERSKHNFIRNYAYCFAGIIFIHFLINIGMTLGIMPVIGIPLPFISKGGTALLVFSLMTGLLLRMDLARNRA